ncbi:hypothetical protein [Nonomuraea sp. NPDC050643]
MRKNEDKSTTNQPMTSNQPTRIKIRRLDKKETTGDASGSTAM